MSEMGALAARQLHAILPALVDVDDIRAREVAAVDDDIDARYHETFDQLLTLMRADAGNVNRGTHLLLVAHDLERIRSLVINLGLPVDRPPGLDRRTIVAAMRRDKKVRGGVLRLALPERIGRHSGGAHYLVTVPPEHILWVLGDTIGRGT